ncbi:MAG: glycosyltransferase [Alphaproteobacteria bacterium]|nr:glycosyltransferase [Alphaproteobacteria bacterium]
MTENPLISVIIPIYNAEKYLTMSLKALQNQTYKNFEALMINDGSSDNSEKIAAEFAAKDARFKLFNQQNQGGSVARNKGLELAQGDYIAFSDNDDIYAPVYLEVLLKNLQENKADVSCCSYVKFYGDGNYVFDKIADSQVFVSTEPFVDKFARKKKIEMLMWCKLYKKSLFENIKFSDELPAINDMLLNIEILLKSRKLVFCRQPLIAYRILESSQTNKRLSDKRIAEYAALPRLILALSKQYPAQKKLLRKIAARYAFGQCIEEILQKYDAKKDVDIYQKMRGIAEQLRKEGFFKLSALGLSRKIKLMMFLHK